MRLHDGRMPLALKILNSEISTSAYQSGLHTHRALPTEGSDFKSEKSFKVGTTCNQFAVRQDCEA